MKQNKKTFYLYFNNENMKLCMKYIANNDTNIVWAKNKQKSHKNEDRVKVWVTLTDLSSILPVSGYQWFKALRNNGHTSLIWKLAFD